MRILGISGSLQARSANTALLRVARDVVADGVEFEIAPSIADLPHYNADLDGDVPPTSVAHFRAQLVATDGVLIATPEYAHEMPGSLKNALDWVVGSGELIEKPIAIVSGSPGGGERVLAVLGQTLTVMSATVVAARGIPTVRGRLDPQGDVQEPEARAAVAAVLAALVEAVRARS